MGARDYALLVGINGYPRFDNLRHAESDARSFETSREIHAGPAAMASKLSERDLVEALGAPHSVVASALTDALETFPVEG